MTLLRVASIGYDRRCRERTQVLRQEAVQPRAEFILAEHLAHEHRFDECGGEKVVERRLVGKRCVPIRGIPPASGVADRLCERIVLRGVRVVEREDTSERSIAVTAGADRIRRGGNELSES